MSKAELLAYIADRVLVLDGAMGTSVHRLELPLADYQGRENCPEILNLTRPDKIVEIHRGFLAVGCDAVLTNTFGANKIVFAEFGLVEKTREINRRAAEIAREACRAFEKPNRPRFVIGSLGPGTKLPSLGQTTWDVILESYTEQVRGLLDGGVDAIAIETCQDLLQAKSAIVAATDAMVEKGREVAIFVTVTMETTGTMLLGTEIGAALTALEIYDQVVAIGLNCATGPQEMSEHIRYLSAHCDRLLIVQPNAGLPQLIQGKTHYPLTPKELAKWLREFVEVDGVNIVGGCCGTTPEHMASVVDAISDLGRKRKRPGHQSRDSEGAVSRPDGFNPRDSSALATSRRLKPAALESSVSSLYQAVPIRQENAVLAIGERTNANGSKKFRELMAAGDIDGMVQMAREQVKHGSHLLDVCTAYVGRDEVADMTGVIRRFVTDVTVPLVIDSTEIKVIEAALKLAGSKCVINSINLEDGEEKTDRLCRLAKRHGAALIALTIDEEGMAKTGGRKLAVARRIYDIVTQRHRISPSDLIFDPLTFTICTGNEEDRLLGKETLEAIKAIKETLPGVHTVLGLSNISFGLKPAVRKVLNSVFLHHARQNGLDAAILHVSGIVPLYKIDEPLRRLAEDLIFDRRRPGYGPLQELLKAFPDTEALPVEKKERPKKVEERLKLRIIEGDRTGLEDDLEEAMLTHRPLDIVNDILLDGMKTVGDLFGAGQMQLPFVLQSAETMKASVRYLEPHMDRVETGGKGSIVLATVAGDVHDIGKNLVDIILTNNGYTVFNLGIKQPIGSILHAYQEHKADAIGMSGLLVKSTVVMRDNLAVLNERGIKANVILGGAALTRKYVEEDLVPEYRGPLFYAKDAFAGLQLMERIVAERDDGTKGRRESEPRDAPLTRSVKGSAHADLRRKQTRHTASLSQSNIATRGRAADEAADGARVSKADPFHPSRAALARIEMNREAYHRHSFVPPRSDISRDEPVPQPPFWGSRVVERIEPKAALAYVNENMLFQVQWQYRKNRRGPEEWQRYLNDDVRPILRHLLETCERDNILQLQAIYGFWPAQSDGDALNIYDPNDRDKLLVSFEFPRMGKPPYWCLSDFFKPVSSGVYDVAAFSVVTAGRRVSEVAREWFAADRYKDYLHLHGLGVEMAEALAEYIHKQIRVEWGVAGSDARDKQDIFKQRYQGSRYSFGYPACPRLEDQLKLWPLLHPERIGVSLTEEFQLEPEQTTTALIAHHRQAKYFNVR